MGRMELIKALRDYPPQEEYTSITSYKADDKVDHILRAFRLTSLGIALARLGFLQRRGQVGAVPVVGVFCFRSESHLLFTRRKSTISMHHRAVQRYCTVLSTAAHEQPRRRTTTGASLI